jgi:segregation and condensation protein A
MGGDELFSGGGDFMQGYSVKLDGFEGPLDLLLHLINQYEIDIYDIPVAVITEQYMHYIHTMQQLELNIASEYLVMAATLLAMKSQLLLPNQAALEDELAADEEDPRDELMHRLIEYRKYKEAAADLKDKEMSADKLYTRPPAPLPDKPELKPLEPGEVTVYDMVAALERVFRRKAWTKPLDTKVQRAEIVLEDRMGEVLEAVKLRKQGVGFFELFPERTKQHIVVTFMAILELMKMKQIVCKQEQHFEELTVFEMGIYDGSTV